MFQVICRDTGEPEREQDGAIRVFESGEAAAVVARELSATWGKVYQPRPLLDDKWQQREQARLEDGTYRRLPWDDGFPDGDPHTLERDYGVGPEWQIFSYEGDGPDPYNYAVELSDGSWTGVGYYPVKGPSKCWHYSGMTAETRHHYAHVSVKVPGNIAFTQTAEKGVRDIQTSMKPGRYLQQYYGHVLTKREIEEHAQRFLALYGTQSVKFAYSADVIERVYVNGPRSCMSHGASAYGSPFHPVRVYAAGDLAVAYLEEETEDDGTRITARALCWPEHKTFGRIYGNRKLAEMLSADGWTEDFQFAVGARLERHTYKSGFVVPYIDGVYRAADAKTHLIIDPDGDIGCERTNGLSCPSFVCDRCGGSADEEDATEVEGDVWCAHCVERYSFYCECYGERYCDNTPMVGVYTREGRRGIQQWSQDAFDHNGWTCSETGDCYSDAVASVELADGAIVCGVWFEEHGYTCDCGNNLRDGETCPDCPDPDSVDGEDTRKHRARQGRDESAEQEELPLAPSAVQYRIGDRVSVRPDNTASAAPGLYDIVQLEADDRLCGVNQFGLVQRFTPADVCYLVARGPVREDA